MSELYRVVYTSRNLLDGTEGDRQAAVREILAISKRNNGRVGITGALLFNGGSFAQVLEGPRPVVERTFERIQRDPRHSDVNVLQCEAVGERGFPNWSMAFVGQSARGRAMWNDIAGRTGFDLAHIEGEDLFSTLHSIVLAEEGPGSALDGDEDRPASDAGQTGHGRPDGGRDFSRLRVELQDAMPTERPSTMTLPGTNARPVPAMTSMTHPAPLPPAAPEASVLRAALAAERDRTTALRRALDESQVALAIAEHDRDRFRQQRDQWAARIKAVAAALTAESPAVEDGGATPLRTVA